MGLQNIGNNSTSHLFTEPSNSEDSRASSNNKSDGNILTDFITRTKVKTQEQTERASKNKNTHHQDQDSYQKQIKTKDTVLTSADSEIQERKSKIEAKPDITKDALETIGMGYATLIYKIKAENSPEHNSETFDAIMQKVESDEELGKINEQQKKLIVTSLRTHSYKALKDQIESDYSPKLMERRGTEAISLKYDALRMQIDAAQAYLDAVNGSYLDPYTLQVVQPKSSHTDGLQTLKSAFANAENSEYEHINKLNEDIAKHNKAEIESQSALNQTLVGMDATFKDKMPQIESHIDGLSSFVLLDNAANNIVEQAGDGAFKNQSDCEAEMSRVLQNHEAKYGRCEIDLKTFRALTIASAREQLAAEEALKITPKEQSQEETSSDNSSV